MTPKERLLTVLKCGIPDRVPISTYEMFPYHRRFEYKHPSYDSLLQALVGRSDSMVMWDPPSNETVFCSSYQVDMDVETFRNANQTITKKTLHTPKGDLTQTTKVIDNIKTIWQTEHWCKSLEDVEKVLSIPYEPLTYNVSECVNVRNTLKDQGIIMSSPSDPLWLTADLMEFGDYTVWAMTESNRFEKVVKIMHERNMENLRRQLDANTVELYRICGPEYATPPYLPKELFQRFVVPYVTEMVDLIHEKGGLVRFHSHGKINQVLDMICSTGADGIDPCEGPPDGDIPLEDVKKRCKGKMCVFGNIQLKLLENGSPEDVDQAIRTCMDQAKEGGGFVIMPTASPINIPLSDKTYGNYMQFIESALKYGMYE